MKNLKIITSIIFLLFLVCTSNAQEVNDNLKSLNSQEDIDTLNVNLIGLNVYPVFSVFGGGYLPNTKMFIQYKRLHEKFNLRASFNFINFNKKRDIVDIMSIKDLPADSMSVSFRKFYYKEYTYDFRMGIESAFNYSGYRLYLGAGLVVGCHSVKEDYSHLTVEYKDFPISYSPLYIKDEFLIGNRQSYFFKSGLDFSFGADISLSQNTVLSVQYTPELVYFHNINTQIHDVDKYYNNRKLPNGLVFIPDYIDLILSIRF